MGYHNEEAAGRRKKTRQGAGTTKENATQHKEAYKHQSKWKSSGGWFTGEYCICIFSS